MRIILLFTITIFLFAGCGQKEAKHFEDSYIHWDWAIPGNYTLYETDSGFKFANIHEFPVAGDLIFVNRSNPDMLSKLITDFQANTQTYKIPRPSAKQEEINIGGVPFSIFVFEGEKENGAIRVRHSDRMLIGKFETHWAFIRIEGMNPNKVNRLMEEIVTSHPAKS